MKRPSVFPPLAVIAVTVCAACSGSPGRPGPSSQVIPPGRIMDFNILYAQNCSGCHDHDGKGGAAISLSNPVFLAITDDAAIRRTTTNGVSGTPMPAFARSAGGMLTDEQIDAVVSGIRSWAKPAVFGGEPLPPYAASAPGDPTHGAQIYATYCATCHGPDGRGGSKASSIVNGSYLALVSDQNLRTIVIAGRPELGAPDWRDDVPGNPMSPQDISDVVAWLASQRPQFSGQPYTNASASLMPKEFHDSIN
jgi:cytochrome c oxidase cbb3-type subunit 3